MGASLAATLLVLLASALARSGAETAASETWNTPAASASASASTGAGAVVQLQQDFQIDPNGIRFFWPDDDEIDMIVAVLRDRITRRRN